MGVLRSILAQRSSKIEQREGSYHFISSSSLLTAPATVLLYNMYYYYCLVFQLHLHALHALADNSEVVRGPVHLLG
jgi:hypothetical protein